MSSVVISTQLEDAALVITSQTHGVFTVPIDKEDADRVADHSWYPNKQHNLFYFLTKIKQPNGKWKTLALHRFVMDAQPGVFVDHRDPNNTLDNRKANLRIATRTENMRNKRSYTGSSSKFKGVSRHNSTSKWDARIQVDSKQRRLGSFVSEVDAARAYDAAATELFGEFALLNFPQFEVAA